MREHKQSDSPSGFDREIHRSHRVTALTVMSDFNTALTRINADRVRDGQPVPALEDVRDVLGAIRGLAVAAQLECFQETLDKIGALSVAARLAHARQEVLSPTSGDAA